VTNLPIRVGQVVRASHDIMVTKSIHITVLSSAAPLVLKKGTEAEISAITPSAIEVNCKAGHGHGPNAWGLKLKVARGVWGNTFS
jgi:hypothetical protein